jgi:hypothetical protein
MMSMVVGFLYMSKLIRLLSFMIVMSKNTHTAYEEVVIDMSAPNANKFNTFYRNIISIYTSLIYAHCNRDTTGRTTRA